MEYLTIEGAKPYDGRYPIDLEDAPFTVREWGWIKRLSDYLPASVNDGFVGGDPELMLAIAAILLRRAGKIQTDDVPATFERIADQSGARLRWVGEGAEAALEPDPTASSNGSASSSGPDSSESSTGSDAPSRAIGTLGSDTSPSVPVTSES